MNKRQIYVFKKTPTTMDQLRPGDIFSMDPASEKDKSIIDSDERYFVEDELPKPQEGKPEGFWEVRASRLIKDPNYGKENTNG